MTGSRNSESKHKISDQSHDMNIKIAFKKKEKKKKQKINQLHCTSKYFATMH